MPELPPPICRFGYTPEQLREALTPGEHAALVEWFGTGQTGSICEGAPPCDRAHGVVVYRHDVERWVAGLPVID